MTAKQYLGKLKWIEMEIKEKNAELEELEAIAEGCSAKQITGMPGGSGSGDRLGDTVSKMVDLENHIIAKIDEYMSRRQMISEAIDRMQIEEHRLMLSMRYIRGRSWEQIAEDMHISERQCYRIHGYALAAFTKQNPQLLLCQ